MVDFPLPLDPTKAIFSLFFMTKFILSKTFSSLKGYLKLTFLNSMLF